MTQDFRRRFPTFTRVPVKVPSVRGWPSECAQSSGVFFLGRCEWVLHPPFLVHPFFLCFCPLSPTRPRAIFFPKIPSFWDLRSVLSRREKATRRGWVLGTVLDGVAPQEKKENPFFSGTRKKGEHIYWVVKLHGVYRNAECKLPKGRSRSYNERKLLFSGGSEWSRKYREIS